MTRDESTRSVYEADLRARYRHATIDPNLKRRDDGAYKRTDIEADYQTFKTSWEKQ